MRAWCPYCGKEIQSENIDIRVKDPVEHVEILCTNDKCGEVTTFTRP